MSKKRVTVATTVGLACGVLASVTEVYGFKHPLPPSLLTSIVLGRTVLGFIIGISAWRTSWWWHGMALGVVLNLPLALEVKWAGTQAFVGALLGGLVFGFVIELVTSVGFKAPVSLS
jgi:hypothetical protein